MKNFRLKKRSKKDKSETIFKRRLNSNSIVMESLRLILKSEDVTETALKSVHDLFRLEQRSSDNIYLVSPDQFSLCYQFWSTFYNLQLISSAFLIPYWACVHFREYHYESNMTYMWIIVLTNTIYEILAIFSFNHNEYIGQGKLYLYLIFNLSHNRT